MNKYNKATILVSDGGLLKREVDRASVVFRPKEHDGKITTSDDTKYYRDAKGCIRRVNPKKKEKRAHVTRN